MPYPNSEQLPNGTPAIFALKDPRWLKLLVRRSVDPSEDSQEPQALARRAQVSAQGRVEDEYVPAAGVKASYTPQDQQPILPPRPVLTPAPTQDAPVERPRSFGKLDPLSKVAIAVKGMMPAPDQPIASAGPQVNVAQPIDVPQISGRGFYGQGVSSPEGEATIRPKVVDKLGYAETHTPMPRHGRLYETGKGALLGFLGGVGRTGTLGGGVGGALTLGTMSAFKPEYAEAAQNQMFTIPKLQQQEAVRVGRNEQALKQAGQVADINVKTSQAYKNLHPQVNKQHVTVGGRAMVFDPASGTYSESNVPNPKEYKMGRDRLGPFFHTDDPNDPIVRPKGAELNQFVNVPGYGDMTPGEKYRGDRADAGADASAANENSRLFWKSNRDDFKAAQASITNYNKLKLADRQNFATGKAIERDKADVEAEMKSLDPTNKMADRVRYNELQKKHDALEERYNTFIEQARKNAEEMNSAGTELQTTHKKYARLRDDGTYEVYNEPQRQPVRSRRMQQSTAPISENDFVEAARQKMGGSFDEGKARAAYRKRYGR